jgi:hypothetical protein
MTTVLRETPCAGCASDKRIDGEPPVWFCTEHYFGEHECDLVIGLRDLDEMACSWAKDLATLVRHVPRDERIELAERIADAFSTTIQNLGGLMDQDVFMAMAGGDSCP